jgi:hypothetical protein
MVRFTTRGVGIDRHAGLAAGGHRVFSSLRICTLSISYNVNNKMLILTSKVNDLSMRFICGSTLYLSLFLELNQLFP